MLSWWKREIWPVEFKWRYVGPYPRSARLSLTTA